MDKIESYTRQQYFEAMQRENKEIEEAKEKIPEYYKMMFKNYRSLFLESAKIKNKINIIYYEMSGVKAVRYDKERVQGFNKDVAIERYYKMSEAITEAERNADIIKDNINFLDNVYKKIPNEEIKNNIYIAYMRETELSPFRFQI